MAFKANYNQQRAERNRLKQAKKETKLRERQEAVLRRRSGSDTEADTTEAPDETTAEPQSGESRGS